LIETKIIAKIETAIRQASHHGAVLGWSEVAAVRRFALAGLLDAAVPRDALSQ
jgi:hypothetical protein